MKRRPTPATLRRLEARVHDDSADRSAIGLGRWDPVARRNIHYTIEGRSVADHLSYHLRSFAWTQGHECADLLAGCPS